MRTLVYDTHSYDRTFLDAANGGRHKLEYTTAQLDPHTAALAAGGVRVIVQRSTGYNNLDLAAAERLGIACYRVRDYSPYSVAEFAVALLQTLNRKTHRAYNRTREHNFRLAGLLGRDLHGQTVGVVGTGRIGAIFARIMHGFGCPILAYDVRPDPAVQALGATYVPLEQLLAAADIVSLHVPLLPATHHLLDAPALARCKRGVTILNTSRGKLIDTEALIDALQSGHVGGVALDVYEEEEGKFFRDLSDQVLDDEVLARLMTFPNVLLTSHQAFFTEEAMRTIAETTIGNLDDGTTAARTPNRLIPAESGR